MTCVGSPLQTVLDPSIAPRQAELRAADVTAIRALQIVGAVVALVGCRRPESFLQMVVDLQMKGWSGAGMLQADAAPEQAVVARGDRGFKRQTRAQQAGRAAVAVRQHLRQAGGNHLQLVSRRQRHGQLRLRQLRLRRESWLHLHLRHVFDAQRDGGYLERTRRRLRLGRLPVGGHGQRSRQHGRERIPGDASRSDAWRGDACRRSQSHDHRSSPTIARAAPAQRDSGKLSRIRWASARAASGRPASASALAA